jgi:Fic family protein
VGRLLPNPHLLIAPYVAREAVLSSRIEGTEASLSDLLINDVDASRIAREKHEDVREVRNHVTALEYGIRRMKKLPLSLRLVREIHARLMQGVRGNSATPGEFRRSQNWIGASNSTLTTATYVPPPVNEMQGCLDQWERFLHRREAIPDLVQCALMHEHFEAIHPFLDGNGRVGRLLVTLFLIERGRLSQPLLYLSAYIERHRTRYYELLQRVRTHGDWPAWVLYFLNGVETAGAEAARQAARLLDIRERYRGQADSIPRAAALIDQLLVNPYMTVARAQQLLKVSNPTARSLVERLVRRRILSAVGEREWGRLYVCHAILKIIESRAE